MSNDKYIGLDVHQSSVVTAVLSLPNENVTPPGFRDNFSFE